MRGLDRAYEAIQEHMRGRLVERFHKAYANITGRPLRLGKVPLTYSERFRAAVDPEERARLLAEEQSRMAALRERVQGRFAQEGKGRLRKSSGGPCNSKRRFGKNRWPFLGASLGRGIRWSCASRIPFGSGTPWGGAWRGSLPPSSPTWPTSPTARKVTPIPGVNLGAGTRFVRQQRAIKFAKTARKSLMALGMGSGKTLIQIGTYTELNAEGKARKGLFIVPSVVRNQFAEEMARFTEPGRYRFHAKDAPFHERLEAYRDPNTHMVVVTHQTFRDDMLRLMAAHTGLGLEEFQDHFKALPEEARRRLLRETLRANGMDHLLDYVAIDEGHQALGREGSRTPSSRW
ncbi:DEAD/DEAH box helicase family protein [Thermus antranikianii]|uniref:DEAD/DEAH box helicase family protein n=1 Tax=Thermus antranikianii TaxID=88190 RepID=UPI001C79528D|nr:DEAD/DEAH box helicase family protein [Thermus antranikianii]QWK23109.1 MAG: DEAD/DEAH box helicase family protein [Thermus antranikianii]